MSAGDGMTEELLTAIQLKVAVSAIPPSAMRNQGAPGVAAAARSFLATLPLRPFAVRTAPRFADELDAATQSLCEALPTDACAWGTSRKAVNLFLRDCYYNKFLHDHFGLYVAEQCFEIPLDGIVAEALGKVDKSTALPDWEGVKYLKRPDSDMYQASAFRLARTRGFARVHLDTYLWPAFARKVSVV